MGFLFATMTDQQCRAYNDAVRHAAKRANEAERLECFSVWYDDKGTFYVCSSTELKPEGTKLVCVAQRWERNRVQLRFSGAQCEWVNF